MVYLGFVKTNDNSGVYVDFESFVERQATGTHINFATFTTRVGGMIGVGKNLLWVVVLSCTSLLTISSFVKRLLNIR